MKNILFITLAFMHLTVRGQGTLYVSNVGQTSSGSMAIGSDSWVAQSFYTGAKGANADSYTLDSVRLLMDTAVGTPSGFTVSIYDSNRRNIPVNTLGELVGSSNPTVDGLFTYTASNIPLLPLSFYFVVVKAATPVSQGAFVWSAIGGHTTDNVWGIPTLYYSSGDGLNWTGHTAQAFQLAIYATPVPEPSMATLVFLGSGILFYVRARNKRRC